jgi:hypothetical protein
MRRIEIVALAALAALVAAHGAAAQSPALAAEGAEASVLLDLPGGDAFSLDFGTACAPAAAGSVDPPPGAALVEAIRRGGAIAAACVGGAWRLAANEDRKDRSLFAPGAAGAPLGFIEVAGATTVDRWVRTGGDAGAGAPGEFYEDAITATYAPAPDAKTSLPHYRNRVYNASGAWAAADLIVRRPTSGGVPPTGACAEGAALELLVNHTISIYTCGGGAGAASAAAAAAAPRAALAALAAAAAALAAAL